MEVDDARAFVARNHRAVIVTLRADGRPHTAPVLCGVDGSGRVVVSTREAAVKTKNLRRDPRVSVCVLNDGFFGEWLQVDGQAEIVSLPEAMDGLVELYRQISGEHPDWEEFRSAMAEQRRVLLRVEVEHAGPGRAGPT